VEGTTLSVWEGSGGAKKYKVHQSNNGVRNGGNFLFRFDSEQKGGNDRIIDNLLMDGVSKEEEYMRGGKRKKWLHWGIALWYPKGTGGKRGILTVYIP